MMRSFLAVVLLVCGGAPVYANVRTREVQYQAGDTVLKGYLVFDDSIKGKRPGVLVVHEWWGHNEYARHRAEMLAELGYVAFAVDMYGDGRQADHPDAASQFSGEVSKSMEGIGKDRFLAALNWLKAFELTDSERMAAIGYCFGGGTVLHMARFGIDLKGVVSFHGSLATQTPARTGAVKARILVCHGAEDPLISQEQIADFKSEMEAAGADYRFISYEGAVHGFTNPQADALGKKFNLPVAYNPQADQRSWLDMKEFLADIFK